MEGNDFILFKHGCGNDSTYIEDYGMEFTAEAKARFDKTCENTIFYHVEVEFLGNQSNIYNYEQPDDETETVEHPEDDSNPIIFTIRNATLLDWDLTASGKEEIWFDKAPKIRRESDQKRKDSMMRSVRYKLKKNPL